MKGAPLDSSSLQQYTHKTANVDGMKWSHQPHPDYDTGSSVNNNHLIPFAFSPLREESKSSQGAGFSGQGATNVRDGGGVNLRSP